MSLFPCPCCGYLMFGEAPGSYDLCEICFWEDDPVQLEFAGSSAGANRVSLVEAQHNFASCGASEERFRDRVRPPSASDDREAAWRPIDPTQDHFEDLSDRSAPRALVSDERLYYWRTTFWRKSSG